MNHIKKFRTRTHGLSISVSEWNGVGRDNAKDYSVLRVWDWHSAVAKIDESNASDAAEVATEAAEKGSCGCWEYVDSKGVQRGPFSNALMRQWWLAKFLPHDLLIRPYDVAAA